LLLGALAIQHWINGALSSKGVVRYMGILLIAGTGAFWVWEGKGTFQRIYGDWWKITSPDVFVSREIDKVMATHRVFISPYHGMGFMSPAVQGVLHDGDPIYILKGGNGIQVTEQETRQDLSVILFSQDHPLVDRLKKEFPKAQWNECWQYYQTPGVGTAFMYDVFIPASEVPEKPGKLFWFQPVPNAQWRRRIFTTYYGLGHGTIDTEDLSPTLNPVTPEFGAHSVSAEGTWKAPADGQYTFSVSSPDVLQVWLDGKPLLESKPWPGRLGTDSATRTLTQGVHSFRYLSFLKVNLLFPRVIIRNTQIKYEGVLGNE
jgi:hypothetical protein